MSKKSIILICCASFVIGAVIGIFVWNQYQHWKWETENEEYVENYDPIEDTEYYKSIKEDVHHKVCQAMVDFHTKDSLIIIYCNRIVYDNDTIPASAIRHLSPEEVYNTYLSYTGSCHLYWQFKKQILKDAYGIEWQSPAELNDDIAYD